MKRRAILELVCELRKQRDNARKYQKQAEYVCNDMKNKEDICFETKAYEMAKTFREQRAGAYPYVTEYAGQAYAFHIAAHKAMWLLTR